MLLQTQKKLKLEEFKNFFYKYFIITNSIAFLIVYTDISNLICANNFLYSTALCQQDFDINSFCEIPNNEDSTKVIISTEPDLHQPPVQENNEGGLSGFLKKYETAIHIGLFILVIVCFTVNFENNVPFWPSFGGSPNDDLINISSAIPEVANVVPKVAQAATVTPELAQVINHVQTIKLNVTGTQEELLVIRTGIKENLRGFNVNNIFSGDWLIKTQEPTRLILYNEQDPTVIKLFSPNVNTITILRDSILENQK